MKKDITHKQRGFFDLGLSLLILAIAGITTAAVIPDTKDTTVAQEQPTVTTAAKPLEQLAYYDDSDDC